MSVTLVTTYIYCLADGDGGQNTNTAGLPTPLLSSIRAVAQCRPDKPNYLPPSTMVVLDNKHNPELEEEEEEETSVVDSLTEEEMMTERSELGR